MVPTAIRDLNREQQLFLCLTANLLFIKICSTVVMLGKKNKGCWIWKEAFLMLTAGILKKDHSRKSWI